MISITLFILVATCVISFIAFSNEKIIDQLIFYPTAITNHNQWYRFITCGFIHADFMHLIFNMYTFYLFGGIVETAFTDIFGDKGRILYIIGYCAALVVCLLPTYLKHKDDYNYRSLGASGAVAAIIFIGIMLMPSMKLRLFPIPIDIPAFIFGPLYLGLSVYLAKRGGDNINHAAHFWGAMFGIVYIIVTCQFMSNFRPASNFIEEIQRYLG